jgi:hypothetical protein
VEVFQMVANKFLGVAHILPFDRSGDHVYLARYEGQDPVEITADEAKALTAPCRFCDGEMKIVSAAQAVCFDDESHRRKIKKAAKIGK